MPLTETTSDDFDRDIEGFTEVATDFGTKIEWAQGVTFDGTFNGLRNVRQGSEDITAGEYESEGERYWSWLPFQLQNALTNIKPGSTVRIICTGDDEEAPVTKGHNKQLGFKVGVK